MLLALSPLAIDRRRRRNKYELRWFISRAKVGGDRIFETAAIYARSYRIIIIVRKLISWRRPFPQTRILRSLVLRSLTFNTWSKV